jgi:uncharacterized membrane protein (UPF0127 family)
VKYLRLVIVGVLIGLGASTFIKIYSTLPKTCDASYRHDTTVNINGESIAAEVAKTAGQQEKGLGGRACIGDDQAMLFTFDKPGVYPFWMKDMKFPIDIVWISPQHKAVTIKPNVDPSTYPDNFKSSAPAQYVLELEAGQANKLGMKPGTTVNF